MRDNYDFSNAKPNPHAKRLRENGYYYPVFDDDGNKTMVFRSPEDIEDMRCIGLESAIPVEIRKRIRNALSQDVSNTRAGGISVGSLERLLGDNDAESLYLSDPEKYVRELECVEKLLELLSKQEESDEVIAFTFDELEAIEKGGLPERALDFMKRQRRERRSKVKH